MRSRLSPHRGSSFGRGACDPILSPHYGASETACTAFGQCWLQVTGLSSPVFRRMMASRVQEIVHRMRSGYVLAPNVPDLRTHLWAFELKLDHWQRALFQACQYRAFAHAALVVMSEGGAHRVARHYARFEALGVGLAAFDTATHELRVLVRPARRRPLSQRHYLFALGRILARQPRDYITNRRTGMSLVDRLD